MRPVIGITCDYDWDNNRCLLNAGYYESVYITGGMPLLIPCIDSSLAADIIHKLDGLILTGGQDLDPYIFDESPHQKIGNINPYRDELEIALCMEAVRQNKPVLGICRGSQLMNAAMGGSLYQDIGSQADSGQLICHNQKAPKWYGVHEVLIQPGTKLYELLAVEKIRTNSFHHQAVKELGSGLIAAANTMDGIVEAIESKDLNFFMGVQWHPECMVNHYPIMLKLFEGLVKAADTYF